MLLLFPVTLLLSLLLFFYKKSIDLNREKRGKVVCRLHRDDDSEN